MHMQAGRPERAERIAELEAPERAYGVSRERSWRSAGPETITLSTSMRLSTPATAHA